MTHTPEEVLSPEYDKEARLAAIRSLDSELLELSDTRQLVEIGLDHIASVTMRYGTPQRPRWASGSYEDAVFMSFHNGGDDGHSSVGESGAGVPRNVLRIARAVNEAAGWEVYDPLARAIAFNAAAAHDVVQLCGRSLLPEGQENDHRGDERLSAEYAREAYVAKGGDSAIAQRIYDGVMATAFNPQTTSQNVKERDAYPTEAAFMAGSLGQELLAAADLLSPTTPRGPLGAFEYCIESLSFHQAGQVMKGQLVASGLTTRDVLDMPTLLSFIGNNQKLLEALKQVMAGQSKFFKEHLSYSDTSIKLVCGKGIDDMFPGRMANGDTLQDFSDALQAGMSPLEIWHTAKQMNQQDRMQ